MSDVLTAAGSAISPAWILVALVGALAAGVVTVLLPPRGDRFPRLVVASIVGAGIGQLAGGLLVRPLPMVGDVHIVEVTIGALATLGIVRLFGA